MPKFFFTQLFFIQITFFCCAQTPSWQWAESPEGITTDEGMGIATDAAGNSFLTGFFSSPTLAFGSTVLTNAGAGSSDIFFVKYDASGNVLWAKSFGGSDSDKGLAIATDADGNIIIAGCFNSASLSFGTTILTNEGDYDMFVARYDSSGNALWARSAGGSGNDRCYGIATDADGNVFATGYFYSSFFSFGINTLINVDSNDIFIVKYNSFGNEIWAKSAGGTGSDFIYNGIATDAGGNAFITGWFSSPILSFDSIALNNAGKNDIFIAKYDSSGDVLWAKSYGGTNEDVGYGIATDKIGNAIITGYFNSNTIDFGSNVFTSIGIDRIFIVKFNSSGDILWAKSKGGNGTDRGNAIATDAGENIYVTGFLSSTNLSFGTTILNNAGGIDIFIVKYDSSGDFVWAKSAGGSHYDFVMDIATDSDENALITGYFYSDTLSFDSIELINSNTGSNIYDNIFIAKIGIPGASISEKNHISEFEVYPNPATNLFFLNGNYLLPATIELYDITGRKVLSKLISEYRIPISISSFSRGLYLYRLKTSEGKKESGKLMVK